MIATLLSTVFGIGYARIAPGTIASAVALPFAWAMLAIWGPYPLVAASLAVYAIGVWSTGEYARRTAKNDPSECVIDEVAGQWLVLVAAPLDPLAYLVGFVLFRVADITKPWPASWADRKIKGGFGVMLDDALAAIYGVAVMLLYRYVAGL